MREPRPARQLPCAYEEAVGQLVKGTENPDVASTGQHVVEWMRKAHGKLIYHMVKNISSPPYSLCRPTRMSQYRFGVSGQGGVIRFAPEGRKRGKRKGLHLDSGRADNATDLCPERRL